MFISWVDVGAQKICTKFDRILTHILLNLNKFYRKLYSLLHTKSAKIFLYYIEIYFVKIWR